MSAVVNLEAERKNWETLTGLIASDEAEVPFLKKEEALQPKRGLRYVGVLVTTILGAVLP